MLRLVLEHFRTLLDAHGEIAEQVADRHARAVRAVYLMVRRRGQLPLDGVCVVDGEGVVRAVLVVARRDGQQRHGRQRGEEGAVAAEEGFVSVVLGGVCAG
jgi:hypothetical protein